MKKAFISFNKNNKIFLKYYYYYDIKLNKFINKNANFLSKILFLVLFFFPFFIVKSK